MKDIGLIGILIVLLSSCTGKENRMSRKLMDDPKQDNSLPYRKDSLAHYPLRLDSWPQYRSLLPVRKMYQKLSKYLRENDYPSFYGGDKVTNNNRLLIYIVGDTLRARKKLTEIMESDDFLIVPCDYSFATLRKVQDSLVEFIYDKKNKILVDSLKIINVQWNLEANRIFVSMEVCNDTSITCFKNEVGDFKCLIFKEGNPNSEIRAE